MALHFIYEQNLKFFEAHDRWFCKDFNSGGRYFWLEVRIAGKDKIQYKYRYDTSPGVLPNITGEVRTYSDNNGNWFVSYLDSDNLIPIDSWIESQHRLMLQFINN